MEDEGFDYEKYIKAVNEDKIEKLTKAGFTKKQAEVLLEVLKKTGFMENLF